MKTCYVVQEVRAIADLVQPGELTKDWTITRISVPEKYRGNGYARCLMEMILKDADTTNTILQLEIQPSDGLNYEQLRAWYVRKGFRQTRTGYWRRLPQYIQIRRV